MIVKENYNFFVKEILAYYFVIETAKGDIIIETKETNLKHLLGIHKSYDINLKNKISTEVYELLSNGEISLSNLIDENRLNNNTMTTNEYHIYNRNLIFQNVFSTFIYNPEIYIYLSLPNTEFQADYIHFCWYNEGGGYLGIQGGDTTPYHYFNSVMLQVQNPEKYKGSKIKAKV